MSFCNLPGAAGRRCGVLWSLGTLSLLSALHAHANTPPKIFGTPTASVTAAHYYSWQPMASDANRRRLTFSILNRPSWAHFDSSTGRLYGTPIPPRNVGTFSNIIIKVSDGASVASLPAFSVKVLPLPNIPPTISGTPATAVQTGEVYSFQPTAKDANGLRVTFGIWDKPSWATFNNETGRIYGTPSASDVGTTSNIIITAYDGYHHASLPAFSITVRAPAAPIPTSAGSVTLSWLPPTENTDGTTLTNLAGYHIYYGTSESELNQLIDINTAGLATYVISNLLPGTWYFTIAAFNSDGTEGDRSDVASIVSQ